MFSKITWMMILLFIMALLFTACGGGAEVDEVEPVPELALPEQEPGPGPELEEMTEAEPAEPGQITQPGDQELLTQGERLFRDHCAACHQQNGEGQGQLYPALNNNPFVTNQSPLPALSTVLHGRGAMPSFRNALSERQVAAVVSSSRNAWNNDASVVGLDEVGQALAIAETPAEEEAAAASTGEGDGAAAEAGEGEQPAEEAAPEPTGEAEEGQQPEEETTAEPSGEGEQPEEEAAPEPTGEAAGGTDTGELLSQGEQVYAANCAACHGPEGQGGAAFPALAGSEFLTGDPTQAIQVVLHGRGIMPAFGGTLSNEQIAAVLSYERNSWGNEAEVISPEEVAQAAENSE